MGSLVTESLLEPFGYGLGFRQILQGIDPAAGAGVSFKVPGQAVLRPVSCVFTLATSAVAAARYVTLEYQDPAGVAFAVSGAGVTVTASSTQRFAGDIGRGVAEWATGCDVLFPMVNDFVDPGNVIVIKVANIDGGDQVSNVRIVVDSFSTGPRGIPQGAVPARRGQ